LRAIRYILTFFAVCILILTSFLGGFLTRNWMLARVQQQPSGTEQQFAVFWEAWNVAQRNYVDVEALDNKTMTYGAIRGMLDSLGDLGHTRFMTPEDLAAERTSISGQYSGIGAEIGIRDGMPMIQSPFDDSPAQKAGLQPGDIIVRVDGEDISSLSLDQVVSRIKGLQGTSVTLTIMREGSASLMEFTIVRDVIRVAAVSWAVIPETHIAHIRISRFSENAIPDLKAALEGARGAGAGALIVDLRNNPGGLLDQAVQVASQFLASGNVVLEQSRDGTRKPYPVRSGGTATDIPIVLLVNEGSASASEIVAGAIQDNERGVVVGQATFGTGTVLSTFLGTAQWLTPDGRSLRHEGVTPDEEVALPSDGQMLTPAQSGTMAPDEIETAGDAQLARAIQILSESMTTAPMSFSAAN
jgi:carboxyl-terminal processing protease